jgi:hypothetical protein
VTNLYTFKLGIIAFNPLAVFPLLRLRPKQYPSDRNSITGIVTDYSERLLYEKDLKINFLQN